MVWPGLGHGLARPWPSGAGGEASGTGPDTLGTPGPWGPGTLATPGPRHCLRLERHLAMARSWPGQTRQHIFGSDGKLIVSH